MINLFTDVLSGLRPGDSEVKEGIYPKDYKMPYTGNAEKDKQKILKMISDYEDKINVNNFIGWPMFNELGGFSLAHKVMKARDRISELDSHPNKQGHERIAEFLYDRLG